MGLIALEKVWSGFQKGTSGANIKPAIKVSVTGTKPIFSDRSIQIVKLNFS